LVEQTGCPVYIVHVSSEKSLDHIQEAQQEGLPVFAETCPQYLLLEDSVYDLNADEAVKYIMSPPLRKKADNQGLWQAIETGLIRSIGTDHCPFMLHQKIKEIKDFRRIPNGAGGVEHRLTLLYTFGVLSGKITLEQFVSLCSAGPARIFGLYPQKGVIAEGADADIVIWNPDATNQISVKNQFMYSDINIYEGLTVNGFPSHVLSRGRLLVDQGTLKLDEQKGNFLKTNSG